MIHIQLNIAQSAYINIISKMFVHTNLPCPLLRGDVLLLSTNDKRPF